MTNCLLLLLFAFLFAFDIHNNFFVSSLNSKLFFIKNDLIGEFKIYKQQILNIISKYII